jgi:hypothetical protein
MPILGLRSLVNGRFHVDSVLVADELEERVALIMVDNT